MAVQAQVLFEDAMLYYDNSSGFLRYERPYLYCIQDISCLFLENSPRVIAFLCVLDFSILH